MTPRPVPVDLTTSPHPPPVADGGRGLVDECPGSAASPPPPTDGLVERLEVIIRFLAVLEVFKQALSMSTRPTPSVTSVRWLGEDGLTAMTGDRVRSRQRHRRLRRLT
jgi:hypothetical protein